MAVWGDDEIPEDELAAMRWLMENDDDEAIDFERNMSILRYVGNLQLPKGAIISLDDFTYFDDRKTEGSFGRMGWFIDLVEPGVGDRRLESGRSWRYAIIFLGTTEGIPHTRAEAHCSRWQVRGGEPVYARREQSVPHPFSFREGCVARVADWVVAIARESEKFARLDAGAVDRDEGRVGAIGTREANGLGDVSSMSIELGVIGGFGHRKGMRGLREWLSRALAHTQIAVELAGVHRMPLHETLPDDPQSSNTLRHFTDDEVRGYADIGMFTAIAPSAWMTGYSYIPVYSANSPSPYMWLQTAGGEVTRSRGNDLLSWEGAQRNATLVLESESPAELPLGMPAQAPGGNFDYLLLHPIGTDMAMPLPMEDAVLTVSTINDGATVTFSIEGVAVATDRNRRRYAFALEWERWLDPEVELSVDDIAQGVARANQAVVGVVREAERQDWNVVDRDDDGEPSEDWPW